jgi:hypothetical protein
LGEMISWTEDNLGPFAKAQELGAYS